MLRKLSGLLQTVKNETGIDSALFSGNQLVFGTEGFRVRKFTLPHEQKGSILQPEDAPVTVITFGKDITAVLDGSGDEYLKYAALIKVAASEKVDGQGKELTFAEKLRLYLLGELDEVRSAALAANYRGAFDSYVLTLVTDTPAKLGELKGFLEAIREQGDMVIPYDDTSVAFIKKCGEEDEYQSANDFAFTLYDSIKEELRINFVINVGGTVHKFTELGDYFRRCSLAYAFGKMMSPGAKIYSYKEYIMIKMLSEIPSESLSGYLDTLLDRDSEDILGDSELMSTAEEFLKNSLNISETSRSMYMHRNTLIYRLDKIEKSTGLNLRRFNDAVAFRILTVLDKLVKNSHGKKK